MEWTQDQIKINELLSEAKALIAWHKDPILTKTGDEMDKAFEKFQEACKLVIEDKSMESADIFHEDSFEIAEELGLNEDEEQTQLPQFFIEQQLEIMKDLGTKAQELHKKGECDQAHTMYYAAGAIAHMLFNHSSQTLDIIKMTDGEDQVVPFIKFCTELENLYMENTIDLSHADCCEEEKGESDGN